MRPALVAAVLGLAPISAAEAHIHLLSPTARQTSAQGDPQKQAPCGSSTLLRDAARVTTLQPGATITVTWAETIDHPGWFRIALQPDGDQFQLPPAGTGTGGFPDDATGTTDTAGALILQDHIMDGTTSTTITLPTVECANCTLQFIQVMTGSPPYDPTPTLNNDLYFNCADLVLAASAPDAGPQVGGADAGADDSDPQTGSESGGCAAGGTGSRGWLVLGITGAIAARRRRRRA